MENTSTDHLPITAEITKGKERTNKWKIIRKRSMKNFTTEEWKNTLVSKPWENLGKNRRCGGNGRIVWLIR